MKQSIEQLTSEDGTRRVIFYKRDDSTYSYEVEKFLDEPEEMIWAPIAGQSVKVYDSLEIAKREAAANIEWLS